MEDKKGNNNDMSKSNIISLNHPKEEHTHQNESIIQNVINSLTEIESKIDDHLNYKRKQPANK